jgi:hypothetical protein
MKKTDVGEIQHKIGENKWGYTKNGLGEDFWNILAQDFFYRTELQDASGKICLCMPMPSRGNDKNFQLQVQMLETMIMMHP